MISIPVEYPEDWSDYDLIDSGNGEKFERFGPANGSGYTLVRPDPRAIWQNHLDVAEWQRADAAFKRTDPKTGTWEIRKPPPADWRVTYDNLIFTLKPTEFKHVGVFPEQAVNWVWLQKKIAARALNVLNLFAYTGGATMAAAAAGASVTHVDAVKSTISWANENVKLSGLEGKPIRWIEDDAFKFVLREERRGNTYDGIIMDPPRFGRGTRGELWKLEEDLPKLMKAAGRILSQKPSFFLVNAYTADISSVVLSNMMGDIMKEYGGTVMSGELALKETGSGRLLPNGIFARWSAE